MSQQNKIGTPTQDDFFSLYLKYAGVGEVSPVLHRWGALMIIAVLCSRRIYFRYGTANIYPNLYVVYMGESASKKSTAINRVAKTLRLAGFDRFAPGETSKGKFAMHLAGIDDIASAGSKKEQTLAKLADILGTDKKLGDEISESFICAGELANFLGINNYDFASFLGDIWDKDDAHEVSYKTSGEFKIVNPLVNLLGGNTFEGMMKTLPPDMLGQGFLSRVIFVYAPKPQTKIAFPSDSLLRSEDELMSYLSFFASIKGEIKVTEEARLLLSNIYNDWGGMTDHRFKAYSGRRFTQLIKVAMLEAVSQKRMVIEPRDAIRANTWLSYTEAFMPRALGEYGAGRHSMGTNAVMNVFYANPQSLFRAEQLWEQTSSAFDKMEAFQDTLAGLIAAKKVAVHDRHFVLGKLLLPTGQYIKYDQFAGYINLARPQ